MAQKKGIQFGKNIPSLVIFIAVVLVVVGGGLMVTKPALLFSGDGKEILSQNYPGLNADELASYISAKTAFDAAKAKGSAWQSDALFISLDSKSVTWKGAAKSWDVVYASEKAKKTLHVEVDKSGVKQQYEGTGKDVSGYVQHLKDLVLDSPKILELVVKDGATAQYINQVLGDVNPEFILYEKDELRTQSIYSESGKSEVLWKIVFKPVGAKSKGLAVWVDAQNGTVLSHEDVVIE
ncbi:MAG: hypothetical protein WCP97_01840 [bacterium]